MIYIFGPEDAPYGCVDTDFIVGIKPKVISDRLFVEIILRDKAEPFDVEFMLLRTEVNSAISDVIKAMKECKHPS